MTTFGAGLLIGTALIIIIPEGVESLFGEGQHFILASSPDLVPRPGDEAIQIHDKETLVRSLVVQAAGDNKQPYIHGYVVCLFSKNQQITVVLKHHDTVEPL